MIVASMPPTTPAAIDVYQTGGASSAANFISERFRKDLARFREFEFFGNGLAQAFDSLSEVEQECSGPNWDGYQALPVNATSLQLARRLLESIPLGMPAPTVGVDPDGQISLEWYRTPRHVTSVSISDSGELNYASLLGARRSYGSEPFSGSVPRNISELVYKTMVV